VQAAAAPPELHPTSSAGGRGLRPGGQTPSPDRQALLSAAACSADWL